MNFGRRTLRLELPIGRPRGSPESGRMDVIREVKDSVVTTEEVVRRSPYSECNAAPGGLKLHNTEEAAERS